MELSSMLCGSLDGSGVWGGMDTWICMAESLCCSIETITTLLIDYIPMQNKKLKNKCVDLQCSMCVSWVKAVNCLLKSFTSLQIAFICLLIYQLLRRVLICELSNYNGEFLSSCNSVAFYFFFINLWAVSSIAYNFKIVKYS